MQPKMKLLYACLAVSSVAAIIGVALGFWASTPTEAMPLTDYLEASFNEIVSVNDDGFTITNEPYLKMEVSEHGLVGHLYLFEDGQQNDLVVEWDIKPATGLSYSVAARENLPTLGIRQASESCSWSAEATGVEFYCQSRAVGDINGEVITFSGERSFLSNLISAGHQLTINLSYRYVVSSEFYVEILGHRDHNIDFASKIEVNDVDICQDLASGCKVEIEASLGSIILSEKHSKNLSFNIQDYAAVLKLLDQGSVEGSVFLRKVDRDGNDMKLTKDGGWWSLHGTNNANWQRSMEIQQTCDNDFADSILECASKGGHLLFLQVPTKKQWLQDARPELMALAEPWIKFGQTVATNLDKIPYIAYYLDHLLATFDDEFDCSKYVLATGVDTQLSMFGSAYWTSLNQVVAEACTELNEGVMEVIQSPEISMGLDSMREYVSTMDGPAGHAMYEEIFGQIF